MFLFLWKSEEKACKGGAALISSVSSPMKNTQKQTKPRPQFERTTWGWIAYGMNQAGTHLVKVRAETKADALALFLDQATS